VILKDVVHNALMGLAPVRALARRFHHTGIERDEALADAAFAFVRGRVDVRDKDVLEIGVGQAPGLLVRALSAGARSAAGADTEPYLDAAEMQRLSIDYRIGTQERLPFENQRFDVAWSLSVLEHVRHPALFLAEACRVLRPGGVIACDIDLRDHHHLDDETRWLDCLRHSERTWNAMTWNRSSYVNRLRASEWRQLFAHSGLEVARLDVRRSAVLAGLSDLHPWLAKWSEDDVAVFGIDVVLRKAG
jgi:SAM-dependent methyltransferase